MRKLYGILALLALFGAIFAADDSIAQGKALVDSKANCSNLTDTQLESIGDYIMELMHPGQAHIYMENMMGGEGSQSLKNVHIQIAQVQYCGKTDVPLTYGGMMGMGMMGYGAGITSGYGGMMGGGAAGAPYGYGMMGNYGYQAGYPVSPIGILLIVLLIGLILVVYVHVWQKLKGDGKKKA